MADDAVTSARDEILRKVGRNVLNFARIEAMLKLLNAHGHVSGKLKDLPEALAAAKKVSARRPMGRLVDEFVRLTYSAPSSKAEQPSDEPTFTFSFRIEADKGFVVEKKKALRAVVVERNKLIHEWLPSFDGSSVESCEAFGVRLDEQHTNLRPEFEALRAIVLALQDGRRELARYFDSDAFKTDLDNGSASA